MPEATPVLYATRADVASILSTAGIDVRIDDDDDGTVTPSPGEEAFLDDAILEATDVINVAGLHFYSAADMGESLWVRRRAAYLAAHFLSMRRGNPGLFCELGKAQILFLIGETFQDREGLIQRLDPVYPLLMIDVCHFRSPNIFIM